MVARLVRDEEVVGSNPAYPTKGCCRFQPPLVVVPPVTAPLLESGPAKGSPEALGVS